jgi:hypothetical protein
VNAVRRRHSNELTGFGEDVSDHARDGGFAVRAGDRKDRNSSIIFFRVEHLHNRAADIARRAFAG